MPRPDALAAPPLDLWLDSVQRPALRWAEPAQRAGGLGCRRRGRDAPRLGPRAPGRAAGPSHARRRPAPAADARQLALRYHLFALEPIAALARIARANARPFDGPALDRLVGFAFAACLEPSVIERLCGVAQAPPEAARPAVARAHGLEVGNALLAEPVIEAALTPWRPFRTRRLGGDVSLLWRSVT